jgi:hypothetical protein
MEEGEIEGSGKDREKEGPRKGGQGNQGHVPPSLSFVFPCPWGSVGETARQSRLSTGDR